MRLLVWALAFFVSPALFAQLSWHSVGTSISNITVLNDSWFFLGPDPANDNISSSPDGYQLIDWTNGAAALAYGNRLYVALDAASNGLHTFKLSTSGTRWSAHTSSLPAALSITFGNGTFVAVGKGGATLTSTNGTNWNSHPSISNDLNDVIYSNSEFIAVGKGGIFRLDEERNWQLLANTDSEFLSLASNGSAFVAVGSQVIARADNLAQWNFDRSISAHLRKVIYANGKFTAIGQDPAITAFHSIDGLEWTTHTIAPAVVRIHTSIGFLNALYLAAAGRNIYRSEDGLNWTPHRFAQGELFLSVTKGPLGWLVTESTGQILTSKDGLHWARRPACSTFPWNSVYALDHYVACTMDGTVSFSRDTTNWTTVRAATGSLVSLAADPARGMIAAVVERRPTVVYTTNLTNWLIRTNPVALPVSITFAQDKFVVAGEGRRFATSSNLVNWRSITLPLNISSSFMPMDIVGSEKGFVAVGRPRTMVYSPDGETWSPVATNNRADIWGVTYGNGVFVAVGDAGLLLASPNGRDWHEVQPRRDSTQNLEEIHYADGKFVVVSVRGHILVSDAPHLTLGANSVGTTSLVTPPIFSGFELENSQNLQTWNPALTDLDGTLGEALELPPNEARRFFRIKSLLGSEL